MVRDGELGELEMDLSDGLERYPCSTTSSASLSCPPTVSYGRTVLLAWVVLLHELVPSVDHLLREPLEREGRLRRASEGLVGRMGPLLVDRVVERGEGVQEGLDCVPPRGELGEALISQRRRRRRRRRRRERERRERGEGDVFESVHRGRKPRARGATIRPCSPRALFTPHVPPRLRPDPFSPFLLRDVMRCNFLVASNARTLTRCSQAR